MRRSLLLLSVASFCFVSGALNLGTASAETMMRAETLTEAAEAALNQHPVVQAAIAGRDLAKAQESEKYSDYFPQVNVNAAGGRIYGDNSTSRGLTVDRGAGYSGSGEGSVSVREMLFDGMQTKNNVAAARERIQSANDNIIDVRENLALRVALAYLDVLRSRESAALLREHEKKIADYRTRIESMVADGGADQSMAAQARDIQNQLDGTLADVEGQANKALADYNEATGHSVAGSLVRPAVNPDLLPDHPDKAIELSRQFHPGLRAARFQGDAAAYDVAAEKGTLYPDFTGELSYYKKDVRDLIGGEVTDGRALIRMNWDFSTGGAQLAKIRQTREREAQTRAQMADLVGRVEREIRKSYAEMDAAKKRLEVNRDRVAISKELVETYEKQFEAGKVTILNLLQAENTDFNARLGLLNADYRYQAAQYSVLAGMGQLQPALNIQPAPVAEVETTPVISSLTQPAANTE